MHQHRRNDPVAGALKQIPDHGAADAVPHHHEAVDPEMVHQVKLVVGEAVPSPLDLEGALRLATIGVPQIERDNAVGVAEFFQWIEGMVCEPRDRRVQPAAGNNQQWEARTRFLVVDLHGTVFIDWHGVSPFLIRYTSIAQMVSTLHKYDHTHQNRGICRHAPEMESA